MSELPPLTARQKAEVDEAMSVFVQTVHAMGLRGICIVDGRGHSACLYHRDDAWAVTSLLASSYSSVSEHNAKEAN